MPISFKFVRFFVTIRGKYGKRNWETAKIGIRTPLKLNCMSTSGLFQKQQACSRPHFRAVRKVLWKIVKNCVCNRTRPDEIDTETEICTSLKSEFYFWFRWPPSISQRWLVISQVGFLWRSLGKYGHHSRKTAKIGLCTSLKSVIYFPFVSETIALETTTFLSGMQNLVKIGKELRT